MNFFSRTESREINEPKLNPVVNRPSSSQYARATHLAVVEACISLIANCFMQSTIQPEAVSGALKRDMLANLIRFMLSRGESLAVIEVDDNGKILLNQSTSWDVQGQTLDPNKWIYQVQISYPSGGKTIRTSGDGVIHLRYSSQPESPYIGLSPLYFMQETAGLIYSLDRKFDEEAQTSTGQIVSLTMDATTPQSQIDYDEHYKRLSQMQGGIFIERQNRERGSYQSFAGRQRIGPEFSDNMIQLRDRLEANIASAFGIPIELLIADGEGTATREAFRRFILTTVQPLAIKVEEELSIKLEQQVELSFEALRSADLQGIGRAIKNLVDSGIPLEEALKQAGL